MIGLYCAAMDARQIDPRTATWEDDFPVYRVVFWVGDAADEWDVEGATDVHQAIAWATEQARGRNFTLSVVARFAGDEGVLRVLGADPTKPQTAAPTSSM